VTRSSFDNDERHVTAFRPISEAARSPNYCFWLPTCSGIWRSILITGPVRPTPNFRTREADFVASAGVRRAPQFRILRVIG